MEEKGSEVKMLECLTYNTEKRKTHDSSDEGLNHALVQETMMEYSIFQPLCWEILLKKK